MRISSSSKNCGTAAVEFGIVAPVLILMLAGILVYGLYFGAAHSVQQIAADAARAAVAGLSDEERREIALNHADVASRSYRLLKHERLSIAAGPSPDDADIFVVTVTYDASELPIFGLDQLIPLPGSTIAHAAAIRRGGY